MPLVVLNWEKRKILKQQRGLEKERGKTEKLPTQRMGRNKKFRVSP